MPIIDECVQKIQCWSRSDWHVAVWHVEQGVRLTTAARAEMAGILQAALQSCSVFLHRIKEQRSACNCHCLLSLTLALAMLYLCLSLSHERLHLHVG